MTGYLYIINAGEVIAGFVGGLTFFLCVIIAFLISKLIDKNDRRRTNTKSRRKTR